MEKALILKIAMLLHVPPKKLIAPSTNGLHGVVTFPSVMEPKLELEPPMPLKMAEQPVQLILPCIRKNNLVFDLAMLIVFGDNGPNFQFAV